MIDINSKLKNEHTDFLFKAILSLKTIDECYDFFDDICTVTEIKELTQRINVARMLKDKVPYSEIVKETGASTATISRVNRCLLYGSDGYNKALERVTDK